MLKATKKTQLPQTFHRLSVNSRVDRREYIFIIKEHLTAYIAKENKAECEVFLIFHLLMCGFVHDKSRLYTGISKVSRCQYHLVHASRGSVTGYMTPEHIFFTYLDFLGCPATQL